jgi:SAM-dependent methyltransferase
LHILRPVQLGSNPGSSLQSSMKILNLGCGTKTVSAVEVINIDWSIYLSLKRNWLARNSAPLFLNSERLRKFNDLPSNILVHDLSKGIPFSSNSVDAVYHSHVLEHLDQPTAKMFLEEIKRVLVPGGILRIVVPDLEKICIKYFDHIKVCENNMAELANHDEFVGSIIRQCVQIEASGTRYQKPFRRFVENLLLGDARKRGQMHLWMYDRFNLVSLLDQLGYTNISIQSYNTSLIPNWNHYGLDLNTEGLEYKSESLYVEALN